MDRNNDTYILILETYEIRISVNYDKIYQFFHIILIAIVTPYFVQTKTEIECNILFPKNYTSQGIKVYQAGEILHTKTDDSVVSFFVKECSKEQQLYFLIVRPSDITYTFKNAFGHARQQTIEHISVLPTCLYKFYKISMKKNQALTVSEENLHNGIIPDTTVLIFHNPAYIDTFVISDNHIPTIIITDNLLKIGHGQEALHTEELIYLFDTLHMDPLHQKSSYRVVTSNPRCKQVIRT